MNRKYPLKMFLLGLCLNFFIRYALLFLPGLVLCIIGIWSKKCLAIGLALWLVDLVASFVEQLRIRKAVLSESDNEEFNELMDAFYGPDGPDAFGALMEERKKQDPEYAAYVEEEERQRKESQERLQCLVVYRTLRDTVRDGMTLDDLIDTFENMCDLDVGEPDMLLFQTGTFDFTGEKLYHFDLVRQFDFLGGDELVQLHLTVLYEPSSKLSLLRKIHWGAPEDGRFFATVRGSAAYRAVKSLPIVRVEIDVHET